MARFRSNEHQIHTTLLLQRDGLRVERVQRFDQAVLLREAAAWSSWQMRVTLCGTRYLTYEGQRYTLAPGTVCWCAPLSEPAQMSWLPGTASDVVDVTWSATCWRQFCGEYPRFMRHNAGLLMGSRQPRFALLPAPPQLVHVLSQLIALMSREEMPGDMAANQSRLLLHVLAGLEFSRPRHIDESQRRRVDRAQAVMVAQLAGPPDIGALAAQLSISPRQLQRDFSACTGLTPLRYLNLMRLSEANFLLAETSLPVAEIAAALGYTSPAHFSAAFRQLYQRSPREVRRRSNDW